MTEPPIACATDLGPSGAIAASWAAYFAKRLGLSVRLIHAKGEPDPELETAVPEMMREVAKAYNERIAEERAALRHAIADQANVIRAHGVEVDPQVLEGRAADVITDEVAREPVSLVVVGPHTSLFDEEIVESPWLPFGTTAERIAHSGLAPVFVARTESPDESDRLQLIFDLEHAEDVPELKERTRKLAERLGASFVVVDHEADLRAMPRDESTMNVIVTAATRETGRSGFLLAAPATRRLRRFPFPVLALPRQL
jgi:nucleotide-binding universal stress UspA family protein